MSNIKANIEAKGSKPTWEPLRLTHIKPSYTPEVLMLAARPDLWHKFIIFDGKLHDKVDLLKAVIRACEPDIVLPFMYREEEGNKSTFLTKCSSHVIDNLVKQNLSTTLPYGPEVHFDIVLGFLGPQDLQLNPIRVVAQAVCHRYEPSKKVLNLDDFEKEKSLGSLFCPISLPKVLHFVLRCAKTGALGNSRDTTLPVRELSLKYNGITGIALFGKFFNYHLTKLDLRHNQIIDIELLRYFGDFKICELWLDGNPLCTKYSKSQDYILAVKEVFPHLQKLDGVVIGMEQKIIPSIQSNFLGDGTKICLIKQFVKHYFTLYDQDDRFIMNGLYDKNALYSMTLGSISQYTYKQITKSLVINRNLLKFVDYAKCQEFLLHGPEKIISALKLQPSTTHNFKTFQIDLLHEGENYIVISVQGLLSYRTITSSPMLFNRTFILTRKEDNEYCIVNEQYYLYGSLNNGNAAGSVEMKFDPKTVPKYTPTVFSVSEKEQLLTFLHELTTMNIKYCGEYLEEANWDIRSAITTFMKMYTVNNVPPEAFL